MDAKSVDLNAKQPIIQRRVFRNSRTASVVKKRVDPKMGYGVGVFSNGRGMNRRAKEVQRKWNLSWKETPTNCQGHH